MVGAPSAAERALLTVRTRALEIQVVEQAERRQSVFQRIFHSGSDYCLSALEPEPAPEPELSF